MGLTDDEAPGLVQWSSGAGGADVAVYAHFLCVLRVTGRDSGCGGQVPPQAGEGVLGKVVLKLTWKRGGADSAYLGGGICLLAVPTHMFWAQGSSLISASPPVKRAV